MSSNKDFCELSARQKRRVVLQAIQRETEKSQSYVTYNLNCNDKLEDTPEGNSQNKEFAVVYFCSDKTTSEIPVSWLTENESACWWPPTRYASSYIVNKYNPDPQTWTKHAVKVEFYCASLKLARKKADDLNCTTEDDDLQRGRGQRKLKRIIKDKGDTSDSESDNSHDSPPHIENHRQVSSLRHDFNVLDIPIVIAEEDGAYSQAMEHEIPVASNMYAGKYNFEILLLV
ncbi:hypothetical protein RN001_002133 [Aquatica leii]|uniref:Uncharacterized protein n=1 Tax=Aquatica leii TaxID=1421715 RepID=A0AAN7Q8D9_9COLE|nr:hypothetical protein RN001_002133 [Aquatica leii]